MSQEASFETIRANCGLLASSDAHAKSETYRWLRRCKPFMAVVYAYRRQRFTIREVARSLTPGVHTMQTSVMIGLLRSQLADSADSP